MGRANRVKAAERAEICRLRSEGLTVAEVAARTGRHPATVDRVIARAGGLPPRRTGRSAGALTLAEREEISRGIERGVSLRAIAMELGRLASTITREVNANGGRDRYRAWAAEQRAIERAARPKVAKLAANPELRAVVEGWLGLKWSPEQIAGWLRWAYPDRPEMWVSHETIYQSLYVQGRGALRKELTVCLRSGRARRKPRGRAAADNRGRLRDMVNIAERPAEVEDRAVPGHWEGDLLMGKNNRSAIATLVERTTRYLMLVQLPDGHGAEAVRDALIREVATLPEQLWRSLTWDQGKEMARHVDFSVATGIEVYFCDPHSPWQRGTNENTNGLLRQYFPKGSDLSGYSQAALNAVAREINDRPRKALGYMKPCQALAELVATAA